MQRHVINATSGQSQMVDMPPHEVAHHEQEAAAWEAEDRQRRHTAQRQKMRQKAIDALLERQLSELATTDNAPQEVLDYVNAAPPR